MKVPKEVLPRFIAIGENTLVPLESVIARNLHELFPGMEITAHDYFRVTRDADFTVSDEADDLVRAVEQELRQRRFGEVVRLEVGDTMEPELRRQLVQWLGVEERQVYDIQGMLDLSDLWDIHGIEGYSDLRDPPYTPVIPPAFRPAEDDEKPDLFEAMRRQDVLVHYPYESFAASVERFVEQAVKDPDVLAIKMTVYRTSDDSALVPSLIEAAEAGKQAVCLVELKARFDERRNITWARALEEAGAHVVHGLPGVKTHVKALLVVQARGRRRQALPERRHRQLPREDRADLRGLRALHRGSGADGGRRRPVQLADGLRPAAGVPQGGGFAAVHARAHPRRDRQDDRGAPGGPGRAHRDEDELAGRPALHRGALPRLSGRRAASTSTCAGSAACVPACRASARTSASSRLSAASSSTPASTASGGTARAPG